ncbi:hypothetical protein [Lignipirellula cremea]|uniref:Uncharacterized protein n=1 Tax=Lignipirellula cremea TaxID=2528010 RepID=A0A518DKT0_9BACT|nr:hypothetical protein [Lignipirellula cremea]QDU92449.1 hypothetical protein Pla8534_01970 [Lignipirellula cremea]
MIDTRLGKISYERWFFQNRSPRSPGVPPLDVRLGVIAGRKTPALAEVTGRLAAYLPQQAALHMLQERFAVQPSVDAYRRVIAELTTPVRGVQDEKAIQQRDLQSDRPGGPAAPPGRQNSSKEVQKAAFWESDCVLPGQPGRSERNRCSVCRPRVVGLAECIEND